MLPSIRAAQARDINYLVDIDLKSYHFPWNVDKWRTIADDVTCKVLLGSIRAEPVAVCAWQKSNKTAEILKLATKPDYRERGAASLLLQAVELENFEEISIIIPEINCLPGRPDDVSSWLLSRGFRAVSPILKDHFYRYGRDYDGFIFIKECNDD